MKSEENEQINELLDFIDKKLALQNVPISQRVTFAAIEFVTEFVEKISINGEETDDFKTDFYNKKWFKSIYKYTDVWYCRRYGESLKNLSKNSLIGVVSFYNTPFKIIVPLSVRGKIEEPGKSAWFTLPNSVLETEDVVEWLEKSPNLDELQIEVIENLYSKITFVGTSLREIYVNLMTAEKQHDSKYKGMSSGITQHLENAANDILSSGSAGVTYAFWDLHLAVEKAVKSLLIQQGSTSYHHHELEKLFKKAKEDFGLDIDYNVLSNLPSSKEANQYRYGEIAGTTTEYAITVYSDVLKLVALTTKELKRSIVMNNASFLIQLPPWQR